MKSKKAAGRLYAVHPGYIQSKSDGDVHFIDAPTIIRLYGVEPDKCIVWEENFGYYTDCLVHLYPTFDGNYSLERIGARKKLKDV